jgi:predicted kinase
VPRLILLNGPPAAGKSTLAQLYADEHPLALNLDIDRIRSMLGSWQHHASQAGLLARSIAIAATKAHLAAGHDVVVPQLVGRLDFIAQLQAAAQDRGAEFIEVFLLADKESLLSRYRERGRADAAADRSDPAVSTCRTDADLAKTYDELLPVITARPATVVVRTRTGEVAEAYQDLLGCLR